MLFTVRANSLQILALVLNGNTQHANHRLLTEHMCCMACFEWILLVCEKTWVQANERIVFELFAMVSCHAVSLCVWTCFFCLRVPKTPLNPANLNSTEMVRIIRVWIGASVGSRYAGWLMIPTPAALWLTPNCPSNISCSSPPSTHPSWCWFRAYHKPGTAVKPPPASRLYFLILFHLISGCLHFFFLLFVHFFFPRPSYLLHPFFFPVLPKNHFTWLRLSLWSQNSSDISDFSSPSFRFVQPTY